MKKKAILTGHVWEALNESELFTMDHDANGRPTITLKEGFAKKIRLLSEFGVWPANDDSKVDV